MFNGAITNFPKYDESNKIIGSNIVTPDNTVQIINNLTFRCLTSMSNTIGSPTIAANGQPKSADMAVKNIANLYFCWYQAANAAMLLTKKKWNEYQKWTMRNLNIYLKFIEKELGRSAADEINMPALNNWNMSQHLPMLIPNSLQIPLQNQWWETNVH